MSSTTHPPLKTILSTRVLELLPGTDDAQLAIRLVEINLAHKPAYIALSYTWGNDTSTTTILVNNSPFQIRHNLLTILLRLRQQCCAENIFVDAIGICRTDPIEKGQQVGIIGQIFRSAKRVLACVGEHADSSETLFDPNLRPADQEQRMLTWLAFLQRPYWTRLWIVQELILAREITIYCGNSFSPLGSLIKYRTNMLRRRVWDGIDLDAKSTHPKYPTFRHLAFDLVRIFNLRRYRWGGSLANLSGVFDSIYEDTSDATEIGHLTVAFDSKKCSDRRDYVYALLTLDKHLALHAFQPDYTIDEAELFFRICLARLSSWPRELADVIFLGVAEAKAWFISRLDRRLLHEAELYRKATRLALDTYQNANTSGKDRHAVLLILADLKCNRWYEDFKDEFADMPGFGKGVLRKFREIHDDDMFWQTYMPDSV